MGIAPPSLRLNWDVSGTAVNIHTDRDGDRAISRNTCIHTHAITTTIRLRAVLSEAPCVPSAIDCSYRHHMHKNLHNKLKICTILKADKEQAVSLLHGLGLAPVKPGTETAKEPFSVSRTRLQDVHAILLSDTHCRIAGMVARYREPYLPRYPRLGERLV